MAAPWEAKIHHCEAKIDSQIVEINTNEMYTHNIKPYGENSVVAGLFWFSNQYTSCM
jgi:hypothetical protein